MRESKKGEKTHLPRDSTAVWLEAQTSVASEIVHRNPPEDTYEAWMKKGVEGSPGPATKGGKTMPEVSTATSTQPST